MISVPQQHEHHHQKVLIKSFHLSGHTFRFCWTIYRKSGFRSFLGLVKFAFGSERVNLKSLQKELYTFYSLLFIENICFVLCMHERLKAIIIAFDSLRIIYTVKRCPLMTIKKIIDPPTSKIAKLQFRLRVKSMLQGTQIQSNFHQS